MHDVSSRPDSLEYPMSKQSASTIPEGVQIVGDVSPAFAEILTPAALAFVAKLQRRFGLRREECLQNRQVRQTALDRGEFLEFLPETKQIREGNWVCVRIPQDLLDRRVEITGPTDRKMVINALNSGAKVFMADFEDANCPTWANMIEGQANLYDAVRGSISFVQGGKSYRLKNRVAVLIQRPPGW